MSLLDDTHIRRGIRDHDPIRYAPPPPGGIPPIPSNGLVWLGRTIVIDASEETGASGPSVHAFLQSAEGWRGVVSRTSRGTGRAADNLGFKRVDQDGAITWHAPIEGDPDTSVLANVNGESERSVTDIDESGNCYGTFRSKWKDSDTAPEFASNTPTTTNTAAATSHAVNVPATAEGDCLIYICTMHANVTITPPAGLLERKEDPFSSNGAEAWIWCEMDTPARSAGTVTFTSSGSNTGTWHVYKFEAGEWDSDAVTAADLIDLGSDSESSGTSPNPGSITPWEDNGEYALIAILHLDGTPTVSSAPTGFTDLTVTASADVTTATAIKQGPGENADAFTIDASTGYNTNVIAIRTGNGTGFLKDDDVGGLGSWDSGGNLRWYCLINSIANPNAISVKSDGSLVYWFARSYITRDGTGAAAASTSNEIYVLDGTTGEIVAEYDLSASAIPWSITQTYGCQLIGVDEDKLFVWAHGTSATTTRLLFCLDTSDLEAAAVWQLDKGDVGDFPLSAGHSVLDRCVRISTGSLRFTSGDTNACWLVDIDEDGNVIKEVDVEALANSGLGSNPKIAGLHVDRDDNTYVYIVGVSEADFLRFNGDLDFVYSAVVTFGIGTDAASGSALGADVPIMTNALSIAVDTDGIVYLGESQTTGIDDAWIGRFQQI